MRIKLFFFFPLKLKEKGQNQDKCEFAVLNVHFPSKTENCYFNIRSLGNPICTEQFYSALVIVLEKRHAVSQHLLFSSL